MGRVLTVATFLGVIGVFSSFLILYIGLDVLYLSLPVLQAFIYLKLSIAGHLTVFAARTEGHFWSVRPAKILVIAVISTQIVATLLCVYGILLPAIGWELALLVWAYSIGFFLLNDSLKVILYRHLDRNRTKSREAKDERSKTVS